MLLNKRAIITGGSRGLGKAIAQEFLKEGADVCICSRNSEELKQTAKSLQKISNEQKLIYKEADISDTNSINALFNYAVSALNGLDILVNNAAIQGSIGAIETQDWTAFLQVINIDMLGPIYCMRKAIEYFKNHGSHEDKCIVNISGGGATGARPFFVGYAVAKTGIVRATETLAKEVDDCGIRINCIAPGAMNTKMTDEVIAAGRSAGSEYEKAIQQKENGVVSFSKASKLVAYLSSDKASGITGRLISAIWDDWENLDKHKDEINESDVYTLRRIIPSDRGFLWKE